jgi:hypothetical protein
LEKASKKLEKYLKTGMSNKRQAMYVIQSGNTGSISPGEINIYWLNHLAVKNN